MRGGTASHYGHRPGLIIINLPTALPKFPGTLFHDFVKSNIVGNYDGERLSFNTSHYSFVKSTSLSFQMHNFQLNTITFLLKTIHICRHHAGG